MTLNKSAVSSIYIWSPILSGIFRCWLYILGARGEKQNCLLEARNGPNWLRKMGLTQHTCGSTGVWRTGRGREKVEIYNWLTLGWFGSSICVLVEAFRPKSNKRKGTESRDRFHLCVQQKEKSTVSAIFAVTPFTSQSTVRFLRKERQIVWFLHTSPTPSLSKQTFQELTWSYAAQTSRLHPTMGSSTAVGAQRS